MDKVAVLIPCYNESLTIAKVISDFRNALPEARIYVYDNNSTDGTAEIASKEGAIVRYEYQQGKGNVIRRMFSEIDAECYLMVDGDDTYPAESAKEMIDKVLLRRVDMVVGDRLSSTYRSENKRLFHNFGNSVVKFFVNLLFNNNIKDIMTGYRAFSYRFVKTFPVLSRGFEIETEMSIHASDKNLLVENVVVDYRDRPEGSFSKLNTYLDGTKVLFTIFKFFKMYKPILFFSLISVLLIAISSLFCASSIKSAISTGVLEDFSSFLLLGVCVIIAIVCFFSGIILQTWNYKSRQDFELNLYRATKDFNRLKEVDSNEN